VTSGQYLRGNGTNVGLGAIQAADVPTLNQNTTGSAGACTGNAATATTAGACTGNAATATTAGACTGNAATATTTAGLETATSTVIVSGASAPTAGQVLTATSGTAADWQTPSGGGGGLSELFKFHTTASNNIGNNALVTGMSYEIPANSLASGTSFRIMIAAATASNTTDLYLDTVSGTQGSKIDGGSLASPLGNIYDVICLATGAAGSLLIADIFSGSSHLATINTTVNNYIEVFNTSGGSVAYQNYAMVVIQT
jgi:hypothetical protein